MRNLINTHTYTHAAIGTAVANSSRCAVPQQSLWPAGAFSCDCIFQGERGGGLTIIGNRWVHLWIQQYDDSTEHKSRGLEKS